MGATDLIRGMQMTLGQQLYGGMGGQGGQPQQGGANPVRVLPGGQLAGGKDGMNPLAMMHPQGMPQ